MFRHSCSFFQNRFTRVTVPAAPLLGFFHSNTVPSGFPVISSRAVVVRSFRSCLESAGKALFKPKMAASVPLSKQVPITTSAKKRKFSTHFAGLDRPWRCRSSLHGGLPCCLIAPSQKRLCLTEIGTKLTLSCTSDSKYFIIYKNLKPTKQPSGIDLSGESKFTLESIKFLRPFKTILHAHAKSGKFLDGRTIEITRGEQRLRSGRLTATPTDLWVNGRKKYQASSNPNCQFR